jgi:hypothetical protein
VRGGGEEVRITCTNKDAQVVVHGRNAKEGKVRSREAQSFGWENVKEVGGTVESFSPI